MKGKKTEREKNPFCYDDHGDIGVKLISIVLYGRFMGEISFQLYPLGSHVFISFLSFFVKTGKISD